MNQGKLTLREVGSKSIDVSFSEADEWVRSALKAAAPHVDICGKSPEEWAAGSKLSGSMRVERLDPEYSLAGNFEARMPLLCPRCGAEGSTQRAGDFRVFLKPMGPYETAEEGDDPDYVFLETPYIDLAHILTEQVVAVEPVVEHPDLDLSGKEHVCVSADLVDEELVVDDEFHLSSGQNAGKAENSPFAVLAKLKDLSKDSTTVAKSLKKNKE